MLTKSRLEVRTIMQQLPRMYDQMHTEITKPRWRIIAHLSNLAEKTLTYIGIQYYAGTDLNPIGEYFIKKTNTPIGIIIFLLLSALSIEWVWQRKSKMITSELFFLFLFLFANMHVLFGVTL